MRFINIVLVVLTIEVIVVSFLVLINADSIALGTQAKLMKKYINDEYIITKKVAYNINKICVSEYRNIDRQFCYWILASDWVNRNIVYKNDTFIEEILYLNDDPEKTYIHGNDCDGIAIMFVSILKELGFKDVYLAFESDGTNDHVCVLWNDKNIIRKFNCINAKIYYIERVL